MSKEGLKEIKDLEGYISFGEDQYATLPLDTPDAALLVDEQAIITASNPECEKLFGYMHDELIGKCVSELVPTARREAHRAAMASYFNNPSLRVFRDLEGLHSSGRVLSVMILLRPLRTSGGQLVLAVIRERRCGR